MSRRTNIIAERIKNDWVTVANFCRKNNINYNTLKGFIWGRQRSLVLGKQLKAMGYLKDDSELPSDNNIYDKNKEQVA